VLYLATFVAGIPPSFLYAPVLTDPSAVLTAGNDGQILWGVVLDLCTGMAGIGTAVALLLGREAPARRAPPSAS
jgi:hypothetical protein